jgi:hypothetical protein
MAILSRPTEKRRLYSRRIESLAKQTVQRYVMLAAKI